MLLREQVDEKPILFNSEMVNAVLSGRKTQTRRVMKPQPAACNGGWLYDGRHFADDDQMRDYLFHNVYGDKGSPYGSVFADGTAGRLWVRETWATAATFDHRRPSTIPSGQHVWHKTACDDDFIVSAGHWRGKWRPSIFMPRWASRIDLRLVDVRIERVQDITAADAIAEGIDTNAAYNDYGTGSVAADTFAELWDSINAERGYGWQVNPWVWVVEFERA